MIRAMDYRDLILTKHDSGGTTPVVAESGAIVSDVLECLAKGDSEQDLVTRFPGLTKEGIRACLAYAALRVSSPLAQPGHSQEATRTTYTGTSSEVETRKRLSTLHEIGAQLAIDHGLPDIFDTVVTLTYDRLNAEEASLFVLNEPQRNVLVKVASKGPTAETTALVGSVETQYEFGEGLVGRSFQTQESVLQNKVPPEAEYYDKYVQRLPSRKVLHYLSVPVIIGDEALGVIRVVNKKAPNYSVRTNHYQLSAGGFDEEDLALMQTIASQVAGGIRSAQFIEVQRYYQQIVANSPDPIIVSDSKGKVVVFNKACERIWGFSADEVLGRRVSQFYASEEHAREIGRRLHVSPNSTIEDFHARIKSRTGEIIPISLSASLVRNRLGSLMGSIGVFKDLRQALQLQKEQLTAGKLATLGRLGHTVGHDIKHNIATALNYVDVLAYECSDEELSRIYREIQESLSEAVIKLRNMLMVGRPGLPLMRPITIHEVVREAETLIHQMAASRKVACSIKYSDQEQEMEADVEQLKQVLVNLFDNSIDAIEVKRGSGVEAIGRLEMSVEAVGSWLKLIWTDDGCGIPTERFPQLFIPFNSDKPTGNGLGLFIIKTIIENHRGRIRIESQEGVGTKVEIMLPLSPSEGALVES